MLIEFSVENFRSIRTRQTLSMVAVPRLRRPQNAIKVPIEGEPKFPSLLKTVAIYGPNASGKSTIIKAFEALRLICSRSPSAEKWPLPTSPFRFDPSLREEPSIFEVDFIEKRKRYTFEIGFTSDRILNESLIVYKKGKALLLYSRSYSDGKYDYEIGSHLEGGGELHEAWKKLTGPQTLFISQAVANSSDDINQLREPFRWLSELMVQSYGMRDSADSTRRLIAHVPSFGAKFAEFLTDVDIPISSIRSKIFDERNIGVLSFLRADQSASKSDIANSFRSKANITTTLTHKTSMGEAEFDYEEESDGTKNLMGFALPWYVFKNHSEKMQCNVLIVDELDSSLHPKLVEALVERHINSDIESQLIFTTHDTHLMNSKLLRRDQIWMTERDDAGATQLRSVHDFKGREGEDVEKRYYEGRYRSLPIVKSGISD